MSCLALLNFKNFFLFFLTLFVTYKKPNPNYKLQTSIFIMSITIHISYISHFFSKYRIELSLTVDCRILLTRAEMIDEKRKLKHHLKITTLKILISYPVIIPNLLLFLYPLNLTLLLLPIPNKSKSLIK